MREKLSFLLLLSLPSLLLAQTSICDRFDKKIQNWETRLQKINTVNPELIPLHYFFVEDIRKEMSKFEQGELKELPRCPDLDFYSAVTQYDNLSFQAKNLSILLKAKKEHVDSLFYEAAEQSLLLGQIDSTHHFLDRALQYNHLNAKVLLRKSSLLLNEERYDECIELVHVLYNEATLTREDEMAASDFTILLYNKLYNLGIELLNNNHEAEALDIFTSLETFCKNMPSSYCNDDYYKGIVRSKKGVYHSFLKIAEVARQRGSKEIEDAFLDYAEQYRIENDIDTLPENISIPSPYVAGTEIAPSPSSISKVNEEVVEAPQESILPANPSCDEHPQIKSNVPDESGKASAKNICDSLTHSVLRLIIEGKKEAALLQLEQLKTVCGTDCLPIDAVIQLLNE